MYIERTTRIIAAHTPSRSHSVTDNMRLIPLSLPRIKWLESDPEMALKYADEGAINSWKENSEEISRKKVTLSYLEKDASVVPMRNCDRTVYNLRVKEQMTYEQIARQLKIGNSTARTYFARAINDVKNYYDKLESQKA